MNNDSNFNDLFKNHAIQNKKIEFGFEKEFLLQAINKKSGQILNLNLASNLLDNLPNNHESYIVVEEYSHCLVEVVSPPYSSETVFEGLNIINSYSSFLQEHLTALIEKNYPEIAKIYEVFIKDNGSSPSNLYLNGDLSIQSDQEEPVDLVLIKYKELVEKNKNLLWETGPIKEKIIGIYNHITSFHITMHPTYNYDNSLDIYLNALEKITELIKEYAKYDDGNKTIFRSEKTIMLNENLRDIFLKKFLPIFAPEEQAIFNIPSGNEKLLYLEKLLKTLMKNYKTNTMDKAFKEWNAYNIRPRIINNVLPAMEIRKFGSSFSRSSKLIEFIQRIIDIDNNEYKN